MKIYTLIKNNYQILSILLIGAILRFYNLGFQSPWLDEIHTLNESNPNLSLSELYDIVLASDPHPPLYFILQQWLFKIFGYTISVMRMFSVVTGILGIYGIYLLAKEILDKKAGLFAAALFAVNYFHIFYSQEGRMYSLMTFTTIFAFYYLIKLIKKPSMWALIKYTLMSTFMIYCQFFSAFTLVSQYLILLYFVIKPYNIERRKFLLYCFISGITTLILYLPVYPILKKASERTSFWIPMPTIDVYTQIFKDFFGQSEIVLYFVILLIFIFFVQLFKEKGSEKLHLNPEKDKLTFVFFIMFTWIGVTLLLPLIRSYTALPMLVNRYFINIVPAILIIVSVGLYYVRNQIVRYFILGIIIVFSLTDIVIVKKYYKVINKTQFREISNYVSDNNKNNEPVVSNLGWYFPYFLNNDTVKSTIVDKPLTSFVEEMMADSTKKHPFWYIDAHSRSWDIPENVRDYLNQNFVIAHTKELYYCRTNHYSFIPDSLSETNIAKFNIVDNIQGNPFRYYIDFFDTADSNVIKAGGWAHFEEQDATDTDIKLVLIKNDKIFEVPFQKEMRGDVAEYHKLPYNLDNCGFRFKIAKGKLLPGVYRLGIILKNMKTKKEGFILTSNYFTKN